MPTLKQTLCRPENPGQARERLLKPKQRENPELQAPSPVDDSLDSASKAGYLQHELGNYAAAGIIQAESKNKSGADPALTENTQPVQRKSRDPSGSEGADRKETRQAEFARPFIDNTSPFSSVAGDEKESLRPRYNRADRTDPPDGLKQSANQAFQADFSGVRIFKNSSRAPEIGARAFTRGNDIHFAPGEFNPDSAGGRNLLGHELIHVAQQAQGRVRPSHDINGIPLNADSGLESEADRLGEKASGFKPSRVYDHPGFTETEGGSQAVQRVVYPNMNALLAALTGGPVPNIANFDRSLLTMFQDAANQLPNVDFQANAGLGRVAQISVNAAPPPAYVVEYDPGTPDQNFLVSSVVHELLHASMNANYRRGGVNYPWLNLNLPPGLAGMGNAAIGAEVVAQQNILDQNLQDAAAVAAADNTLAPAMRNHVTDRLTNYAMAMPDVHYDTVLADIMLYMQLNGVNNGPTFRFIRRMIKECNDRRLRDPWWGTQRARRVDRNKYLWQFWKW